MTDERPNDELKLEAPPSAPADTQPADGDLLSETDEAKVCAAVERFWAIDERRRTRRREVSKRNRYWRAGVRQVYLTSDTSGENVNIYAPPSTAMLPPVPNLVDRLCRKTTAQLLADPAQPEVLPDSVDEAHEGAAELSTTMLRVENGEQGTNFRSLQERASDLAHTYASSFSYACVDATGGGWEPMDIYAHPNAVSADQPLDDPEPPTLPLTDPMGNPVAGPDGQPATQPNPKYLGPSAGLVRRFVMPDGTLSKTSRGAQKRWLPKIRYQVLPSLNVSFVPHTVTEGVSEAEGVVLCVPTTLGELKRKFPKTVGAMPPEKLQQLANWRPRRWADLQSLGDRYRHPVKTERADGVVPDDTECYPLTLYFRSHAAYPYGAYIVVAADQVLHKQKWHVEHEDGSDECLELPVAQCRDMDAAAEGDPYGSGLAEFLGPLDEINGQLWVFLLEYMYRHGNPNVYTMATSPVQPEALRRRDGTPIDIMSKDDVPIYEQVPNLPTEVTNLAERIVAELNSESGLEQAAQGVASASVQSGRHAQQIIEQALVSLGTMKRNLDDFITRVWRIDLQLKRAFFTVPQVLRHETDDGSWKQREWSNVDLKGARNVRIARGTSTLLPATVKRQQAVEDFQLGAIDVYELKELTATQHSAVFGRQDNPHRQRVKRQIEAWKAGPETIDGVDDAQLVQQSASIFAPIAADEDPVGAMIRYRELVKLQASTAYLKHPPAWRQAVDLALAAARFNAGVQTAQERAQAQQAQAQAQQQQADADRAAKTAGKTPESPQAAAREQAQAVTSEMRAA